MTGKEFENLNRARARLDELRGEHERVARAPLPLAEARERAVEALKVQHAKRRDAIASRIRKAEPLLDGAAYMLPGRGADAATLAHGAAGALDHLARDVVAMALLVDEPERLVDRAFEGVEEAEDALAGGERRAKLAAIERERAEVERAEEGAVRALEDAGIDVDRRGDADPAVVLAGVPDSASVIARLDKK